MDHTQPQDQFLQDLRSPDLAKLRVLKIEDELTVPSSIFSNACWTPSPDTSLLILRLSACIVTQKMSKNNAERSCVSFGE